MSCQPHSPGLWGTPAPFQDSGCGAALWSLLGERWPSNLMENKLTVPGTAGCRAGQDPYWN